MPTAPLTIGFDLDMTLLDTRPGIKATLDALAGQTDVHIDSDLAVSRLGPPLAVELAYWYPEEQIPGALASFRKLYPLHAVPASVPLPGALGAVDDVRGRGGRVVVVTGKYTPNARLHLDHAGVRVDHLAGELWADAKGSALREQGAAVYVGDHVGDIQGARAAGAHAVAVATGPYSVDDLRAANADTVLADLTQFPAWLDRYLAGR